MKQQQSGFTLIELIAVIVVLGILAAVAVPKFVDLSEEAQTAATQAMAGNISSASALNYAVATANKAGVSSDSYVGVTACSLTAVNSIMQQDVPNNYQIGGDDGTGKTDGDELACTILAPNGTESDDSDASNPIVGDEVSFSMIYVTAPTP